MVETWDFLQSPAGSAAFNMALDEALLLTAAKRARPLLRLYSWGKPSVSFGYFQRFPVHLVGQYEIVRRPTGGGLVYHGDGIDTTYTVVVPSSHALCKMKTTEAYCAIHKAVAAAIGDQSRITSHQSLVPKAGYECFQNPVAGDVVTDGHKLAGGAQRRNKHGMLHQGSVAAKLSADQLKRGFKKTLGVEFMQYELTETDGTLAEKLACEKYANDAWNRYLR